MYMSSRRTRLEDGEELNKSPPFMESFYQELTDDQNDGIFEGLHTKCLEHLARVYGELGNREQATLAKYLRMKRILSGKGS